MKKLNLLLSICIITLVSACGGSTNQSEESSDPETEESSDPEIKLYVFEVGDILVKDISLFNPGVDTGQTKNFTNSAYLIRHPKGDLIWDTGLPDALAQAPDGNDSQAFLMKMPKTLSAQLEEINVSPTDIEFLAVSHLHGDHTGNMNLFTSATLLLQSEEYEGLFEGETVAPAVDSLRNNEFVKLTGDHDVFGDGSVVIKRAPGHTAGHQVLYVNLPETGPIVLSGDLYHFTKNRELRGVPAFNADKEQTLKSMDSVEAFLKEQSAVLWIQHDKEQNEGIAHSPEFHK
ncbi:N-acyl homoserine lactonase family protein [Ekhidna sp.]